MNNGQFEKQREQERVQFVVNEIEQKMESLSKNIQKVGSDVQHIRKTFWEDVTVNLDEPDDVIETAGSIVQQAHLLAERERSQGQIEKQIKTLSRLKNSPYFGRIDFLEEGERSEDQVYLGIASFLDREDENFLIYDWRAPISSLYYDYSPGPSQYDTMEGTIKGDMTLKRQFLIRNAEIEGMFDTGVTIGDQLLQEVLGNNASTQMKSIVATIQKEQNQIIRNEKSKVLMVQGVAGSGKTSAALQRVAYLLYSHRETLRSENIMLFSPNPLFNSYVSTVLPELGEENMQQTTFQEYLNFRIGRKFNLEDPFMQLEYLLTSDEDHGYFTRVSSIQYKSGLAFKNLIDEHVEGLSKEGLEFKNIKFRGSTIIPKEKIQAHFYSLDHSYSVPNRIQLTQEWLLKELKKLARKERQKDWVKEEIQFLDKDDYLEAFKKLQEEDRFSESTFNDFDREEEFLTRVTVNRYFKSLYKMAKNLGFIDMKANYSKLFVMTAHESLPENWTDICEQTLEKLGNSELSYEDATPFIYLQDKIEGRKTNSAVRHVFIDEAQDYSPFQFAFIKQLFPFSKTTLLGDINQGIFSHSHGASSILPNEEIDKDEIEVIYLMRSYRSTRPIVEFTKRLIRGGERIEAFNRDGRKPTLTFVNNRREHLEQVQEHIKSLQTAGHKTIAVICKTAQQSEEVYSHLKEELSIRLIQKGTLTYETGILVIPAYLAKGIEFDAVIIFDASNDQYGRESERRLFYTACTRAMHELHLYSVGKESYFIAEHKEVLDVRN